MDFLAFILTKIAYYLVLVVRRIWKLLSKIPLVDLALYIVADLLYFLLDKLFMTIGTIVAMVKGKGEVARYWKSNAIMLDKKLNVSGQYLLNALLTKKDTPTQFKFGSEFSTVSDTIGRVPELPIFGHWCSDVMLNSIEPDHCAKAVQSNNKSLLKRVNELNLLKYQDN
jgi:hypothetical protein